MGKGVQIVYVVDDDAKMRESLRWLLESADHAVETFESAEKFRKSYVPARGGCIVLDVSMPGMTGIELQKELASDRTTPPIIFLTGHGDIPLAVRAMGAGAFGFLEKPFVAKDLLQQVAAALKRNLDQRKARAEFTSVHTGLTRLTARERQVLALVIAGKPSKEIAIDLDIACRTVENHRSRILRKMQASTTLELVRMVLAAEKGGQ